MAEEKSLKERLAARLEAWKGELDELKVQMALGKKEAEDRYEVQKKALMNWVEENRHRVGELEDEFGEELDELKTRWQALRQKLEEERGETWQAFSEHRSHMNDRLESVRAWLREKADSGSEQASHLLDELDDDLVKFRTRLDLLALQMHLGRMEAEDEIHSARGKSGEILDQLKQRIAEFSEDAEGKWDVVRLELGKAFANIREAWKEQEGGGPTKSA